MTDIMVKDLRVLAIHNKKFIFDTTDCGCYYCCKVFKGVEITEWVDLSEDTALCPYCHIDSVAPNITNVAFLEWAHGYWFSEAK